MKHALVNRICACTLMAILSMCPIRLGAQAAEMGVAVSFQGAGGEQLQGLLFEPATPGQFPAVIALHGCGGLGGEGRLSARHSDWAIRLRNAGYLVLFVDSFGSRGVRPQCRTIDRGVRAWRERVDDVFAARAWLGQRPDVRQEAVSLLGWSNGGTTVLYVLKHIAQSGASASFDRAVALYPGCRVPRERGGWHTIVPLLLLIGAADDWTPAAPCEDLAKAAAVAGEPVTFKAYPGAYHDFDHPNLPIRRHRGLAYSADGSGDAHTGTDPAARADAIQRIMDFLAHRMQ